MDGLILADGDCEGEILGDIEGLILGDMLGLIEALGLIEGEAEDMYSIISFGL